MGFFALFAITAYVWVVVALASAAIVSTVRLRAIPLFWVVAVASACILPFALSFPIPVKHGGDYGGFSNFLAGAFSWLNLQCFIGAICSLLVSSLPIGLFRIASALSWGFVSAFAVRLILFFS